MPAPRESEDEDEEEPGGPLAPDTESDPEPMPELPLA
jgi:hypothetical protein